jgi:hypothetical protein
MDNSIPKSVIVIKSIIIKYSLYATASYIIYFVLMRVLGLAPYIKLRFLNYFLYFFIGYYALKSLAAAKGGQLNYLQGLGVSYVIGALSFIFYAAIVFLYSFFDSFFMTTIFTEYPTAKVFGRFAPPFAIASEGIGLCTIVSLCLMQYFKIFSGRKGQFLFFRKNLLKNPVAGNNIGKLQTGSVNDKEREKN